MTGGAGIRAGLCSGIEDTLGFCHLELLPLTHGDTQTLECWLRSNRQTALETGPFPRNSRGNWEQICENPRRPLGKRTGIGCLVKHAMETVLRPVDGPAYVTHRHVAGHA